MIDRPSHPWERSAPTRLDGVAWPPGRYEPGIACIDVDRETLVARFGEPTFPDEILPGIGDMDVWTLRYPCGLEVALWLVRNAVSPRADGLSVLSPDADIEHVLAHLELEPVTWRADRPDDAHRRIAPEPWTLWRQDDNGHRVRMGAFESRLAAECARATYEARGHRQLYTLERG